MAYLVTDTYHVDVHLVSTSAGRYEAEEYQGESAALVAKISELAIVYQDYFFKEMIAYFKQLFRPPENSCGRSLANPITRNTRSTIARAMRLLPPNRNGSCASAEDNASAGVAEDNRAGGAATLTPFILKMKVMSKGAPSQQVLKAFLAVCVFPCTDMMTCVQYICVSKLYWFSFGVIRKVDIHLVPRYRKP